MYNYYYYRKANQFNGYPPCCEVTTTTPLPYETYPKTHTEHPANIPLHAHAYTPNLLMSSIVIFGRDQAKK